jgi:hypothetical protein
MTIANGSRYFHINDSSFINLILCADGIRGIGRRPNEHVVGGNHVFPQALSSKGNRPSRPALEAATLRSNG